MRTSGSVRASWDVDFLVWIGGDPERAHGALAATLEELREQIPEAYVTFLVDGPGWERALRDWAHRFPDRREVRLAAATDLPQLLYGLGVEGSVHPWVAFLWPGCGVSGEGVRRLREGARGGGDLIYGIYGEAAVPAPEGLYHPVQHGWLQMADLIPMHNCLLARGSGVRFDPSSLLRRSFWWDLTLRLSREGRLVHSPESPAVPVAWDWSAFPFRSAGTADPDLAARYVSREGAGNEEDFRRDLSGLKITLLSGLHDAHQNQLFFYNFFGKLAGLGALTWRTILYERCRPEELDGCDLAVFSRPRFPAVPALLDRCRAAGVPTLVMIDDNWIAAGEEFARFEPLFTPGKPAFEVFLDSLRRADAALVFNPVLEAEVKPLARRVLRLPPNVDLSGFASPAAGREPGFLVGFAGSPRFEASGFRGLARFLARRPQARLLVMAHEVPVDLLAVAPERRTFVPWRHDYAAYARDLAARRPDVLIAPLDASRFAASKIPIKLLESAAVGAAGIYSRVPPYTEHVRDGETGLLVENREEAWEEALERLYADPDLRRRIAANAASEVRERFATERVLLAFLAALRTVAGRSGAAGHPQTAQE